MEEEEEMEVMEQYQSDHILYKRPCQPLHYIVGGGDWLHIWPGRLHLHQRPLRPGHGPGGVR